MSNAKRKIIAEKLAAHLHCSTKEAFHQIDFVRILAQNDKSKDKADFLQKLATQIDLDEEQKEWLIAK